MSKEKRTCLKCNKSKPLGQFALIPDGGGLRDKQCKACRKAEEVKAN